MREFKFRVYDNKDKEMFYSETYQKKTSIVFGLSNFLREISDIEDTLMQYTGLKDKNDVEIYEGDIVQVEGLGVGIIEYIESYFRIFKPYIFSVNLCNYTSTIELEPKNKVEVIGNIYENKDLLSEVNKGN